MRVKVAGAGKCCARVPGESNGRGRIAALNGSLIQFPANFGNRSHRFATSLYCRRFSVIHEAYAGTLGLGSVRPVAPEILNAILGL